MATQLSLIDGGVPVEPKPAEVLDAPDMRGPAPAGIRRLLTAQEVAEILRVPRSTVYELSRNRRIPFIKVGRRTLFDAQALLEWIAVHTVQPR